MKRLCIFPGTSLPIFLVILLFGVSCGGGGEEAVSGRNSGIKEMMSEISADSIEASIRTLAGFHTRHTTSDTANDTVGIGAARRWIFARFNDFSNRSGGRLRVHYDRHTREAGGGIREPVEIVNVVSVLPGTQLESKDRMYVVSGHYDSRVSSNANDTSFAPGANDDASGTAAVLELARVMSRYEFDATIVFMAVAGEEQGLYGSTHYAQQARRRNLDIAAMFTNDIIGNPAGEDGTVHDDVVRVFAEGVPPEEQLSRYHRMLLYTGGENDTPARNLARFIHGVAEEHMEGFRVNMIYRKDRYLRGGDHSAFLEQGYPAVRFTEPNENFRHQHQDVRTEEGVQYGDLVRFLDFDYVARVTRLNAASLAMLANAPARPDRVGIVVSELTNSTTLRWKANEEPDLRGYEIVWRNTTSPYWEFSEFAGDTTQYTIEGVSKDNFLFGVRSVDQYGNRSPAVYPLPVR